MAHDLTPPERRSEDTIWDLARVAVGIPTIGIGAAVFDALISSPLEQRRDEWRADVGQRIIQLEREKGIDAQKLSEDPQFVATLAEAWAASMRTHVEAKRRALRNAVLNSALPGSPDGIRQS